MTYKFTRSRIHSKADIERAKKSIEGKIPVVEHRSSRLNGMAATRRTTFVDRLPVLESITEDDEPSNFVLYEIHAYPVKEEVVHIEDPDFDFGYDEQEGYPVDDGPEIYQQESEAIRQAWNNRN